MLEFVRVFNYNNTVLLVFCNRKIRSRQIVYYKWVQYKISSLKKKYFYRNMLNKCIHNNMSYLQNKLTNLQRRNLDNLEKNTNTSYDLKLL